MARCGCKRQRTTRRTSSLKNEAADDADDADGSLSSASSASSAACVRAIRVIASSGLQPKKLLSISVQDLFQIRFRQTDILYQRQSGCGIPAGIVGAIHHAIGTIVIDGKFDA